jgi:hypothetical protein
LFLGCSAPKKATKANVVVTFFYCFLLQHTKEGNGNYRRFFFWLQCNKEGDGSNVVVTFFFIILLQHTKEGNNNNTTVAFLFFFCYNAEKR